MRSVNNRYRKTLLPALCFFLTSSLSFGGGDKNRIELQSGQRVSFVITGDKEGGEAARQRYIEKALSMAKSNGMQQASIFRVADTIIGDEKANAFGIYSWPNAAASNKVRNNKTYLKEYKPLRKQAWKSLNIIDVDLAKDLSFTIDKSKTYTLAEIWYGDIKSYEEYFQIIQPFHKKHGNKILLKLPVSEYSSMHHEDKSPDSIVLIEWGDKNGPDKYLSSPTFENNKKKAEAGISHIHWYKLGFWDY